MAGSDGRKAPARAAQRRPSAQGSSTAGAANTRAQGVQLRKSGTRAFTPARQEAFFTALAETSNISAAAQSVGVEPTTIWRWRKKNPEFQRRWALALAQGYADLELRLLAQARFGARSEVDVLDDGTGARRARQRRDTPSHGRMLLTIHRQTVMAANAALSSEAESRTRGEDIDHLIARLRDRIATITAAPAAIDGDDGDDGGA